MNKRYYWLKLSEDFFGQKEIKQLRKMAGGDTFTIIYLKMLLRSLKNDGRLYYEGIEQDFSSELALDLDEEVENVKLTVAYLMAKNILVQGGVDEYALLTADEMTGSEGESARRMRKMRLQKLIASQSDGLVTKSDTEIDIDTDIDTDQEKRDRKTRKRFNPPTVDEVSAYANEKGWKPSEFDPEYFINFYASKGWKIGKNTMTNWKASASGWVARERKKNPANDEPNYDYDPWGIVK